MPERPPDVKICGVMRPQDARGAAAAGARYVGAILSPGFPRSVAAEAAADFLDDDRALLVAVFVDAAVADVARKARTAGADVIQLHGDERPDDLRALRREGPWELWKALRVRRSEDILAAAERWVGVADGLLLDGFHEGAGGGQGVRFPWTALESVRHAVPPHLRLIVAGGLTPESVAGAVERLAPDVVDVSSGVEAALGVKDPERVRRFIESARGRAPRGRPAGQPLAWAV